MKKAVLIVLLCGWMPQSVSAQLSEHSYYFLNWANKNSLPTNPGRCVRSFIESRISGQNDHSHTWDNAVWGILSLALDSLFSAKDAADFLSSSRVYNYNCRGYFQAVSIDKIPPRADDTIDWYTKMGHGSGANIFLFQYSEITGDSCYGDTALKRVQNYITWIDTDSIPFFPEITPKKVTENNLIPFADTPWYPTSLLYKSFEETMEFIVSLHWASIFTDDTRYDSLAALIFETILSNYWNPQDSSIFIGSSHSGGVYVIDSIYAFDVFSTAYLAMSVWPHLEEIFTSQVGMTKEVWFLDRIAHDLNGIIIRGDSLKGTKFSIQGPGNIIGSETSGDILACFWGIADSMANVWKLQFEGIQYGDGSWWAGYNVNTGEPAYFPSGLGFNYDGKPAIAAKLALALSQFNWYDVDTCHSAIYEKTQLKTDLESLCQIYPNPSSASVKIEYQLPNCQMVTLNIYNIQGQLVRELVSREEKAGIYTVNWDGKDNLDRKVPSGIYFYRLQIEDWIDVRKMILLK